MAARGGLESVKSKSVALGAVIAVLVPVVFRFGVVDAAACRLGGLW